MKRQILIPIAIYSAIVLINLLAWDII